MAISMRRLPIGQKVTVLTIDEDKVESNNHVCTVVRVDRTLFAHTSYYKYALKWYKEDNPGRRRPGCLRDNFYFMDDEVIPLAVHFPSPSVGLVGDLPDV